MKQQPEKILKEMKIHLHDAGGYLASGTRLLAAIRQALTGHAGGDSELTLALTDDDEVRSLNRQFRGRDRVTDVLSFPAGVAGAAQRDGGRHYLGDIVIAYPHVQRMALQGDRSVEDWLLLLAVHGTLHLLGYTHEDAAAQETMWRAQAGVLAVFGIDEACMQEMIWSATQRVSP